MLQRRIPHLSRQTRVTFQYGRTHLSRRVLHLNALLHVSLTVRIRSECVHIRVLIFDVESMKLFERIRIDLRRIEASLQ